MISNRWRNKEDTPTRTKQFNFLHTASRQDPIRIFWLSIHQNKESKMTISQVCITKVDLRQERKEATILKKLIKYKNLLEVGLIQIKQDISLIGLTAQSFRMFHLILVKMVGSTQKKTQVISRSQICYVSLTRRERINKILEIKLIIKEFIIRMLKANACNRMFLLTSVTEIALIVHSVIQTVAHLSLIKITLANLINPKQTIVKMGI
ncbi:hypothetical protein FGO68_gene9214 [Halteria grandinella]|uniref:Uncharacterized protein n=1 Tax=Halteria grandinella TaxID=5974 RepID=A0A8J8NUX7_HALGN|nr:hypothetical protein FGO68_gene9214 [Halteria grandinella]